MGCGLEDRPADLGSPLGLVGCVAFGDESEVVPSGRGDPGQLEQLQRYARIERRLVNIGSAMMCRRHPSFALHLEESIHGSKGNRASLAPLYWYEGGA
jgi:hypothetical protein